MALHWIVPMLTCIQTKKTLNHAPCMFHNSLAMYMYVNVSYVQNEFINRRQHIEREGVSYISTKEDHGSLIALTTLYKVKPVGWTWMPQWVIDEGRGDIRGISEEVWQQKKFDDRQARKPF